MWRILEYTNWWRNLKGFYKLPNCQCSVHVCTYVYHMIYGYFIHLCNNIVKLENPFNLAKLMVYNFKHGSFKLLCIFNQ